VKYINAEILCNNIRSRIVNLVKDEKYSANNVRIGRKEANVIHFSIKEMLRIIEYLLLFFGDR